MSAADALDTAGWKQTRKSTLGNGSIKFEIEGQGTVIDAEGRAKKSDLWHLLYDTRLEFSPGLMKR